MHTVMMTLLTMTLTSGYADTDHHNDDDDDDDNVWLCISLAGYQLLHDVHLILTVSLMLHYLNTL